jgi:DNA replication protein DnaC
VHRSGLPDRYQEATWEGVDVPDAAEWRHTVALPAFLRRGQGLLIPGPVGTGKSSLAAVIAMEALQVPLFPGAADFHTVRWEYVPRMLDELIGGNRIEVQTRQERPGLLVWDDFGVGQLADWMVPYLDRIVETRYRNRRSMIVTTNIDPALLAGDPALARIMSRWRQSLKRLDVVGKDRRRPE